MMPKEKPKLTLEQTLKSNLEYFFCCNTDDVFELFGALDGALFGKNYVYVPGSLAADERVLLVAHADIAHSEKKKRYVRWYGNLATSWDGLGADDRAGVALMWTLSQTGHSLLITDGEERGGIGAKEAARDIPKELGKHLFAIEVDRRGDMEYVFYNVSTMSFEKWVKEIAGDPWKKEVGSYTDIKEVCPAGGICGINIAAGYHGEHTTHEIFSYDAWYRSRDLVLKLLTAARAQRIRFELPKQTPYYGKGRKGQGGGGAIEVYDEEYWREWDRQHPRWSESDAGYGGGQTNGKNFTSRTELLQEDYYRRMGWEKIGGVWTNVKQNGKGKGGEAKASEEVAAKEGLAAEGEGK